MSINTFFYGLVLITLDEVLVRGSGMSGIGDDGDSLHPYNTVGQEIEPFDYAPEKREGGVASAKPVPGTVYVRFGRNSAAEMPEDAERETRGRSDGFIRFGRSHPKSPHHRNEPGFAGFERIERGNKWVRLGRRSACNDEMNEIKLLKEQNKAVEDSLYECLTRFCSPDAGDTETCRYQDGNMMCDNGTGK